MFDHGAQEEDDPVNYSGRPSPLHANGRPDARGTGATADGGVEEYEDCIRALSLENCLVSGVQRSKGGPC